MHARAANSAFKPYALLDTTFNAWHAVISPRASFSTPRSTQPSAPEPNESPARIVYRSSTGSSASHPSLLPLGATGTVAVPAAARGTGPAAPVNTSSGLHTASGPRPLLNRDACESRILDRSATVTRAIRRFALRPIIPLGLTVLLHTVGRCRPAPNPTQLPYVDTVFLLCGSFCARSVVRDDCVRPVRAGRHTIT